MLLVRRQTGCLAACREVNVVRLLLTEVCGEGDVFRHVKLQVVRRVRSPLVRHVVYPPAVEVALEITFAVGVLACLMLVITQLRVIVAVTHIVTVALVVLPVFQLIVLAAVGGKSNGGVIGVSLSARALYACRGDRHRTHARIVGGIVKMLVLSVRQRC